MALKFLNDGYFAGKVGIGTDSPKQQLHVSGGTTAGDVTKMVVGATGGNAESYLYLAELFSGDNVNYGFAFVADGNSSNNLLFKRHSNSTSGTTVMEIRRDSDQIRFNGYSGTNQTGTPTYILGTTNGGDIVKVLGADIPGVPAGSGTVNYLAKWTPDGDTLGIGSVFDNGNVGIGTSSVGTYKLNVDGAIRIGVSGTIQPLLSRDSSTGGLIVSSVGNSGDFIFQGTGGSEKFRIKDTGDVGIGVTSPGAKLDIVGSSLGIRVKKADLSDVLRVYTQGSGIFMDGGNVHISDDLKIGATLLSNQENTDVDTGTEVVAQVSTSTYTAAFFDFVIKKVGNIRSGTVYACHDGTNVEFTETSTQDLGDTSDVTLSVDKSGTNLRLIATVTSDDWSVKSLIRAI